MPRKRLNLYLTVLLFALLHGVMAEASILIGFNIVLILTMFTMLMAVCLSMQQKMGPYFMVVAVIAIIAAKRRKKAVGAISSSHI